MKPGFDSFAADHVGRLLRLAVLLTGDAGEAEDLTQEALVLTHRKWSRVSAAEHPAAYVRRLLVNLHLTRSRTVRPRLLPLDAVAERPTVSGLSFEDRDQLRTAVGALPPRQRTVLVLRFFEDLDTAEIATATAMTESSVRSTVARALASLRLTLDPDHRQEYPHA